MKKCSSGDYNSIAAFVFRLCVRLGQLGPRLGTQTTHIPMCHCSDNHIVIVWISL